MIGDEIGFDTLLFSRTLNDGDEEIDAMLDSADDDEVEDAADDEDIDDEADDNEEDDSASSLSLLPSSDSLEKDMFDTLDMSHGWTKPDAGATDPRSIFCTFDFVNVDFLTGCVSLVSMAMVFMICCLIFL